MTINASNEFNKQPRSMGALGRSFTLGRHSQNKFTLNPQNDLPIGKAETILNGMATLTRRKKVPHNAYSVDTHLVGDSSKNRPKSLWAATLRKIKRRSQTPQVESKPNSLEQARIRFSDDSNDKGPDAPKEEKLLRRSSIFLGTLKKNVNALLINLKTPEEIDAYLQKAKMFFQNSEYKEAKKNFNKFLSSKHVDVSEKKPEIGLYLAAIYLLENKGSEANECLEGDSFLKIVIRQHAKHLLDPKQQDVPFPKADFYDTVVKTGSEDEKIVSEKLFEVFGIKTPTQDIQ